MVRGRAPADPAAPNAGIEPTPRAGAGYVLLDANALFLPFRERFPLEPELARLAPGRRAAVPSSVLDELDRLVARGRPHAELARRYAERFPKVAAPGRGDDALLDLARRSRAWVVTSDRELSRRLAAAGVPVVHPRGRARLFLTPGRPAKGGPGPRRARVMKRLPLERGSPRGAR